MYEHNLASRLLSDPLNKFCDDIDTQVDKKTPTRSFRFYISGGCSVSIPDDDTAISTFIAIAEKYGLLECIKSTKTQAHNLYTTKNSVVLWNQVAPTGWKGSGYITFGECLLNRGRIINDITPSGT